MSTLARHVSDNLLLSLFQQHSFLNWTDFFPPFLDKVENVPFTITALHSAWWHHPCVCMWLVVKATLQSKVAAPYCCPQNSRANTCLLTLPHHIRLWTSAVIYIPNNTPTSWPKVPFSILYGNDCTFNEWLPCFHSACSRGAHICSSDCHCCTGTSESIWLLYD